MKRLKKTVGVSPSDDDTDSKVDEESRENFEDKRTNDRYLPPNDIAVCTVEETEVNIDNQTQMKHYQKLTNHQIITLYLHLWRKKRNKY